MGISISEINFDSLVSDLSDCCLTEDVCHSCEKSKCLIGYCKDVLEGCIKDNVTFVMDGVKNIPSHDLKLYNHEELILAIAKILKQCRSCKEDHYENCIINTLRSVYEVILFGEAQDYKGSTLIYFHDIKNLNQELSSKIFNTYNSLK